MRLLACTFLSLLLLSANLVLAMDVHAEALGGRHSPELHAGDDCGPDEPHTACHHCCHAQAHFCSLPQRSATDWALASGHDWMPAESTLLSGTADAPPVPPPKA